MRAGAAVLAISRYANGPALYSAVEHDPEKWHRFSDKIMLPLIYSAASKQFDNRAAGP
jgi:hypothetical protein